MANVEICIAAERLLLKHVRVRRTWISDSELSGVIRVSRGVSFFIRAVIGISCASYWLLQYYTSHTQSRIWQNRHGSIRVLRIPYLAYCSTQFAVPFPRGIAASLNLWKIIFLSSREERRKIRTHSFYETVVNVESCPKIPVHIVMPWAEQHVLLPEKDDQLFSSDTRIFTCESYLESSLA